MGEVNLLAKLPKPKRSVQTRRTAKTPEIIETSRQFGELHFDGPREYGYGGFFFDGRWVLGGGEGGQDLRPKRGGRGPPRRRGHGVFVKELHAGGARGRGLRPGLLRERVV